MKNKFIILFLFFVFIVLVSCNIFDWTNNIDLNDPYDLVRLGEAKLNDGDYVKANEYFVKAVTLFETSSYKLIETDQGYLFYMLYYSKSYRGLGTAYLQEVISPALILDIIDRFSVIGTESLGFDDIFNYLLSKTYPDAEERTTKISEMYQQMIYRYQSNFDLDHNGVNDYFYAIDNTQIPLPLGEKRGSAAECFEKAEIIAHTGYLYGSANEETLNNDQKRAYERLIEISTNSALDSILGITLSTIMLALDSSFNFVISPDPDPDTGARGDYFTIKPDYTYSSRLQNELETMVNNISNAYNPLSMTTEERNSLIIQIDELLDILTGVKKFANALFVSVEKLKEVFVRFHERLIDMNLTPSQQALLDSYIIYFVDMYATDDQYGCSDPNNETVYCKMKKYQFEINQTAKAAVGLLSALKLALVLGNLGLDYWNQLGGHLSEESAEILIELLTDPNCFDGDQFDPTNDGCTMDLGDEGDNLPPGAFDDFIDPSNPNGINGTKNVTDLTDGDGNNIGGNEPNNSTMTPATNWKALEIVSTCRTNPLADNCRFLDDM